MKIILVLLDGLGDRSYKALNYQRLKNILIKDLPYRLKPPAEYFLVTQRSGCRIELTPFQKRWGSMDS